MQQQKQQNLAQMLPPLIQKPIKKPKPAAPIESRIAVGLLMLMFVF
jgi:hypothetical protein